MLGLAGVLLTLFLKSAHTSEGALSPPLNLTVDSLDFRTSVRWLPAPGSPNGTRYTLEYIDIGGLTSMPFGSLKSVWNQTANCTNMASTQCYLLLDQHFTNYFVRVRAEWEEEKSNWTCLNRAFQLYSETRLSAPNVRIVPKYHSLRIILTHHLQSRKDVPLKFSVNFFYVTSDPTPKLVLNEDGSGLHEINHLPSGNYCINAFAFYTKMLKHVNDNFTQCFLLPQTEHEGIVGYIIGASVALLLFILAGIVLRVICGYTNPQNHRYTPKLLPIFEGFAMILTFNPEELNAVSLCVHGGVAENTSDGYFERGYVARTTSRPGSISELGLDRFSNMNEDVKQSLKNLAAQEEENEGPPMQEHLENPLQNNEVENPPLQELVKVEYTTAHGLEETESDSDRMSDSDEVSSSGYEPRPPVV